MPINAVYVIDAVRTPIGKFRGSLAAVRTDDLAALTLSALVKRQPALAERIDQVVFGSTNQAGEDNRNVARMALLLAGLPYEVPAVTVNRLCGSGLEAINDAARMIALGEAEVAIAGGVESMTRAPYSMPKAEEPYSRKPPAIYDTTLGWRYPNPKMAQRFDLIGMGETAENVAKKFGITREEQDRFALESQKKAAAAWEQELFADEIVPVEVPQRKAPALVVDRDESSAPDTRMEKLAKLKPAFREGGSVTAGNSSPLNDGAAAVMLAQRERREGAGHRADAALRGLRHRRRGSELHGRGPDPGDEEGAGARRSAVAEPRRGRAERGVRVAEPRVHPRARPGPGARERARRRDRARSPHRRVRRAHRRDAARRHAAPTEGPHRPGVTVHRRRSGHRYTVREGLSNAMGTLPAWMLEVITPRARRLVRPRLGGRDRTGDVGAR